MTRVQKIVVKEGRKSPWITRTAQTHMATQHDAVHKLPGIGKVTASCLQQHGMLTVKQIADLSDERVKVLEKEKGLKQIAKYKMQAQTCNNQPNIDNTEINHRKAANPYQLQYGADWEEKMKASTSMKSYACITELVNHTMVKLAKVMKGTRHEADWLLYHDALTLLTAHKTVDYMKSTGCYDCWVLPRTNLMPPELATDDN